MLKYLCAPLALLALAFAGCGGDDKPSKKEFIADLDKVCTETNGKLQDLDTPRTIKQFPKFVRESRVVIEDSVEQAQDLELPDEDRAGFKSYVDKSKQSLTALDDLEKAAEARDTDAIKRVFAKTAKENEKRKAQAKRLGLKRCGSG